jgi:hypothetical protein
MRPEFGVVLGRVLAVLGGLVLAGIVLRLVVAVLQPILPAFLMGGLGAGFTTLMNIVSPALGPIAAILILAIMCWIFVGQRK